MQADWVGSLSALDSPACHSSPLMELTFAGADKFGCPWAFGGGLGNPPNALSLSVMYPWPLIYAFQAGGKQLAKY